MTGDRERLDALATRAEADRLSLLERTELTALRVTALTQEGLFDEAIARGRAGLAMLGVSLPAHIEDSALRAEIERIDAMVRARGRDAILDAPRTDDPLVRAKCALLSETATPLYFIDPDLSTLADASVLPITLERGLTSDTATALIAVARYLGAVQGDHARSTEIASLALEVARRSGDRGREGEVYANVGIFIQPWHAPLRSSVPLLRRAFELGVVSGGMTFAAYARTSEAMARYASGEPLPRVESEAGAAYELAERMGNPIAQVAALLLRQAARCLRGTTSRAFTLSDVDLDEATLAALADRSPLTAHYRHRLLLELSVIFGRFEEARQHADACAQYVRFVRGTFMHASVRFYGAIARAAAPDAADFIEPLRDDHATLEAWARACPENFACMERAIAAELARLEGRTGVAFDLYDQATALAAEQRTTMLEAVIGERAAAYEDACGRERAARWSPAAPLRAMRTRAGGPRPRCARSRPPSRLPRPSRRARRTRERSPRSSSRWCSARPTRSSRRSSGSRSSIVCSSRRATSPARRAPRSSWWRTES